MAAKTALCIRVDALGESENSEVGIESKDYIERRIGFLENEGGENGKSKKTNTG